MKNIATIAVIGLLAAAQAASAAQNFQGFQMQVQSPSEQEKAEAFLPEGVFPIRESSDLKALVIFRNFRRQSYEAYLALESGEALHFLNLSPEGKGDFAGESVNGLPSYMRVHYDGMNLSSVLENNAGRQERFSHSTAPSLDSFAAESSGRDSVERVEGVYTSEQREFTIRRFRGELRARFVVKGPGGEDLAAINFNQGRELPNGLLLLEQAEAPAGAWMSVSRAYAFHRNGLLHVFIFNRSGRLLQESMQLQ